MVNSIRFFVVLSELTLLILLAGCVWGTVEYPSRTPTLEISPVASIEPTQLPTVSQVKPTSSPQVGIVQNKCLDIQKDGFQLKQIGGTLALIDDRNSNLKNMVLLNLNSAERKIIPAKDTGYYSVSSQGTFLAFESWVLANGKFTNRNIKIINSSGNVLSTVREPDDWSNFEWLDEENLLINHAVKPNPIILFSPFTQKQKIIEPYFKDNHPTNTDYLYDWGFYIIHKNVYDPSLTRALYPSIEDGSNHGGIVVIRDLVTPKDLAAFPTNGGFGMSPKWSPDGKMIAIGLNTNINSSIDTNRYELFLIDRDGEKLFTTHLSSSSKFLHTSYLSWSPDSRFIAFWYTRDEDINKNLELAILDTTTQEITNYCIKKDAGEIPFRGFDFSPLWSPNSRFVLIETINRDNPNNALIIDIVSGKGFPVESGLVPIGWMK